MRAAVPGCLAAHTMHIIVFTLSVEPMKLFQAEVSHGKPSIFARELWETDLPPPQKLRTGSC